MKSRNLWIGVLIAVLIFLSHLEISRLMEAMVEWVGLPKNKMTHFFFYMTFESFQASLREIINFIFSWKGVALVTIYLVHKNIRELSIIKGNE